MCAYLAATYLTVEAVQRGDVELERRFRRRALVAGLVAGALAGVGLLAVRADAQIVWKGMLQDGWPFVALSAIGGLTSLAATFRGRERIARMARPSAVGSVVAGMGRRAMAVSNRPDLTASQAAAPASSLRPIAIGFAIGAALVPPSLLLLFRVFKASKSSHGTDGRPSHSSEAD